MKKVSFALVGAAALALAACGGQGDDALGDNVEAQYDAAADNLDAAAANATDPVNAAMLNAEAEGKRAEGEALSDSIDRADVNAATVPADAVNTVESGANR